MSFDIKDLDKVLQHKNIKLESNPKPDEFFDRVRYFSIDVRFYKIVWYCNICYLYHNELQIPFNYVEQCGTWPNNAKTNLQFYTADNTAVCILPIEYWPDK